MFNLASCNDSSESLSSCLENPSAEGKLIVIVGEKIEIKEVEPERDMMLPNSKFVATYRIMQKICGEYDKDTVIFTAYDHYGFPGFGNYQYALLFLNNYEGAIYHEKYQYFPLYKTKDGKWASNYHYEEYGDETNVKPEKINFLDEVSFSIDGLTRATTQRQFPEPYYTIDKKSRKTIAAWGNYVPELFQLKKDGVLKYRGFYGKIDSSIFDRKVKVEDFEMEKISKADSIELVKTWHSLLNAILKSDNDAIKQMSIDSINCSVCEGMPKNYYENNLESIDMFIDSANLNFKKSGLWDSLQRSRYSILVAKYPESKPETFTLEDNKKLIIFSINIRMDFKTPDVIYDQNHSFEFVRINNRFLFYNMTSN